MSNIIYIGSKIKSFKLVGFCIRAEGYKYYFGLLFGPIEAMTERGSIETH